MKSEDREINFSKPYRTEHCDYHVEYAYAFQ